MDLSSISKAAPAPAPCLPLLHDNVVSTARPWGSSCNPQHRGRRLVVPALRFVARVRSKQVLLERHAGPKSVHSTGPLTGRHRSFPPNTCCHRPRRRSPVAFALLPRQACMNDRSRVGSRLPLASYNDTRIRESHHRSPSRRLWRVREGAGPPAHGGPGRCQPPSSRPTAREGAGRSGSVRRAARARHRTTRTSRTARGPPTSSAVAGRALRA